MTLYRSPCISSRRRHTFIEGEAMPKVYTGTALIPGYKVDAYLITLKVAEEI